jgi:hypothetical protein
MSFTTERMKDIYAIGHDGISNVTAEYSVIEFAGIPSF